ncbi:sugar kinase [Enterobacter hormaechei]|uniref:ROK family transcriptional regulator n=1 Tax=Enterobacter hormaechei TaxID=158836 RepID=UPI0013743A64|nr:ROK family transcriptional regulator [Enterobacter hormaechei]QHO79890.1 sugar kinase [Enterobacter hormaechei]QHO96987.1 ROK family transcriptional regulator [Enterobacter hormaechei]
MKTENNNSKKQKSSFLVRELLLAEGPQSQASISRKTKLSPAMVNYVVKQLVELGAADIHWINGREGIVSLTSKTGHYISILVNLDKICGSLFIFESELKIDFECIITQDDSQKNNPDTVINLLSDVLSTSKLSFNDISGLAISIVAPLDNESETIISWSAGRLPGWRDIKIKSFFEQKLGTTVVVGNDANHSTLAEWTWGVGRSIENFVYIACSKQIGGGIIINNHMYKGSNGMAAEFGHLIIENAGPVCFCGCRGCLTTFISERAIIMNLSKSESYKNSLQEIITAAGEGDAACQRVLLEAGKDLGKALANIAKILAPGMVAIGGDLSGAGPLFFDSVIATIDEHNLGTVSQSIDFKIARINHQSEVLGGLAALLAQKNQGISELPEWIK